jgi:hypothetical protein
MMISIWLSHLSETKAKRLTDLTSENRRLRSEYVTVKSRLMKSGLRSSVFEKLKTYGFVIPKRPPVKVITEDE